MRFSVFSFQFSDVAVLTWILKLGTWNHRRRRPGVTILEVLFAILVTTVGLLGAVALFPVASAYARKARINDAAAYGGMTAFHEFDTRGMRRPDMWVGWNNSNNKWTTVQSLAELNEADFDWRTVRH